jgi:hypothetical protein
LKTYEISEVTFTSEDKSIDENGEEVVEIIEEDRNVTVALSNMEYLVNDTLGKVPDIVDP